MYFEDFNPGDQFVSEPAVFTEEDIIDFAKRFDPQPFHVDPTAAAASIYGGLIASGWHIMAATFGSAVRLGLFAEGGQGAPGLELVRWMKPVRPGDSLHLRITAEDKWASSTRGDRGYVMLYFEIINQRDEVVGDYRCREIYLLRNPDHS